MELTKKKNGRNQQLKWGHMISREKLDIYFQI